MTRESKVGLLVASSFLILVGIVVASKLKNEEEPGKPLVAANGPDEKDAKPKEPPVKPTEPPPHPPQPTEQPGSGTPPDQLPNSNPHVPKELQNQVALMNNQTPSNAAIPPAPLPMPAATNSAIPSIPLPMSDTLPLVPSTPQNVAQAASLPMPMPPGLNSHAPTEPAFPLPKPMTKDNHSTEQSKNNDKSVALPPLSKKDEPLKEAKKHPPVPFAPLPQSADPLFPAHSETTSDNKTTPLLGKSPEQGLPTFPPAQKENAPFPLIGKGSEPSVPSQPYKENVAPPPNLLPLPNAKSQPVIAPQTNPEQPVFPIKPKEIAPVLPAAVPLDIPLPKKDGHTGNPVTIRPNNLATPGIGSAPPISPRPTIGAQEAPSTPPIPVVPNKNPLPVAIGSIKPSQALTDFNMDITQLKPGETNYAQVSNRLYHTDKYAEALTEFNRNHGTQPLNSAFPMPDQKLMYPTAEVLERNYPSKIRATNPTIPPMAQTAPLTPAPAIRLVPPAVAIAPSTTPSITTVSNPPAGQGRSYVVQAPAGERIRDIAQRTLGNADRWFEIYRINQSLNLQPQFPLPAGTRLQLPAN